nr:ribbon-helix-helix domain-containing protein [Sulfuracidifex metallicus]
MRKVVSVRLKEDVVNEIDFYCKKLNKDSRTEFIKEALDFLFKRKLKETFNMLFIKNNVIFIIVIIYNFINIVL